MAMQKLKAYSRANQVPYAHLRQLAAAGLFPIVRIGRSLYVHLETADEWARGGGQAFPGGWRKAPAGTGEGASGAQVGASPAAG